MEAVLTDWIAERVRRHEFTGFQQAEIERGNDALSLSDIEYALLNGRIIESNPDTGRGVSCLVYGETQRGAAHVVCGRNKYSWLVIATVYIPAWPKWKSPTERNR